MLHTSSFLVRRWNLVTYSIFASFNIFPFHVREFGAQIWQKNDLNVQWCFNKSTRALLSHGWLSFALFANVMHGILTALAHHSFVSVQTSSFYFVSKGLTSKMAKLSKKFPKNCSLEECYRVKKFSLIFIPLYFVDHIKFYFQWEFELILLAFAWAKLLNLPKNAKTCTNHVFEDTSWLNKICFYWLSLLMLFAIITLAFMANFKIFTLLLCKLQGKICQVMTGKLVNLGENHLPLLHCSLVFILVTTNVMQEIITALPKHFLV